MVARKRRLQIDPQRTAFAARLASYAYPPHWDHLDELLPETTIIRLAADDAAAIVVTIPSERETWIAIRGSDSLADFRRYNSDISPVEWRTGCCHSGFWRYADRIAELSIDLIGGGQIAPEDHDVYVTGHSLGAAAAVILAHEIPQVQRVFAFGMPNTFNRAARRWIQQHSTCEIESWVDRNDPVPKLPRLRYVPVVSPVYRDSNGDVHVGANRLYITTDRILSRLKRVGNAARELCNAVIAVDDHRINTYVDATQKYLEQSL